MCRKRPWKVRARYWVAKRARHEWTQVKSYATRANAMKGADLERYFGAEQVEMWEQREWD